MRPTTEAMFEQMKSIGYDYVADGWFCVDAKPLRKRSIERSNDSYNLPTRLRNIIFHMDLILRVELTERRVPSQKFMLFHICDLEGFENLWCNGKFYYVDDDQEIPFGTFHAVPHYIEDGPNTYIKYTEQCSRCKEQLSTNLIGSMTLRYTLE